MDDRPWDILIVEDDPDDYILARDWLSESGGDHYRLQWASKYEQALHSMEKVVFDAVLVDYDLGARSGLDLIKDLISRGYNAPFIMLTGRGDYDVDVKAMHAGAVDYISKNDLNPFLLERSIRYAIERKNAEIALRNARDELELRVQERTQDLHQMNLELVQANEQLRLSEEQNRRFAERNAALADFSQELAEAGSNYAKVLDITGMRVTKLLGDACAISLISEDGSHLRVEASYHSDPEIGQRLKAAYQNLTFRLGEGLTGLVAKTGDPVLLPSISFKENVQRIKPELRPYMEQLGPQSNLAVPLRVQGRIIGALGIARIGSKRDYTLEDQTFLQSIANHAAIAMENARLFVALQNELAERKRAEASQEKAENTLRTSEARFRAIFEGSAIGIELRDLQGQILAANPALLGMLGYTEDEMRQFRDDDLIHPEDVPTHVALYQELANGTQVESHCEIRYMHRDGREVWARQTASLVHDPYQNPQFAVALIEDISEWKRMESRLAEVRRRLVRSRESERLALAQELHDGPVQELYGITYSIAAKMANGVPSESIPLYHHVKTEIEKVIRVLRVVCGELRPPTLSPYGLEKTIRSHADSFQQEHPEIGMDLNLQPDAQLLPEPVRLALFRIYQQALANINRHAAATHIGVTFRFDKLCARLEIQDNGQGFTVPEGWIDYVRKGHFGLAGSAERAEAVGGILRVESKPGQGTQLTVEVPLDAQSGGLFG